MVPEIARVWMQFFSTCLDAVFGGFSTVLAGRIESRGAKEEAEAMRKEKARFAYYMAKPKLESRFRALQRPLSEASGGQKWPRMR